MLQKIAALFCRIILAAGKLVCPECGAAVKPPRPDPKKPWETVIRCACGRAGSLFHFGKETGPPALPEGLTSSADGLLPALPQPQNSPITHAGDGMEETWALPKLGTSAGFLFLGILWLAVCLPVAWLLVWNGMSRESFWLKFGARAVFGVGFPVIGLLMLYWGLRAKYARHLLTLDPFRLTLDRTFFGRRKRKSLRRDGIMRVELKEFYSRNYVPVYGLQIRGTDGKLRFGSTLSNEDKAWLAHDVRRALGFAGEEAATPDGTAAHTPALEIEETGRAVTLRLTPKKKSSLATIGLVIMLFCVFFVTLFLWASRKPATGGAFEVFEMLFKIPFVVIPSLFFFLGLLAWREGRRLRRTVIVLHADDSSLTLEKMYRGQGTVERWSRAEVERIQTSGMGKKNGAPVPTGEIVTPQRVVLFGMGCDEADLKAICAAVRAKLGM